MADLVAIQLAPSACLAQIEAAWEQGDAAFPIDPAAPPAWVEKLLDVVRPARLVTSAGERSLEGGVQTDAALVVATSGTTGTPKAVELSRAALEASASATVSRLDSTGDDTWLVCLPTHHVAGITPLLRARLAGSTLVVHDSFDVAAVAAAPEGDRATLVSLVPTQLRRLLDAGPNLAGYRAILLGGAAVGLDLLDRAHEAGASVVVTYGTTETCGGCVYDGRPLDGVEVDIADDADISVRGTVLMSGYRLRPDLTQAVISDGWYRTSDRGRWTGDGRLEVLGRADDVIITGGVNVAAPAVADILTRHPKVVSANVIGEPDPEWGQAVVAIILPKDPDNPPTLDELRDFVKERAEPAAAPRALRFIPPPD